MLANHLIIQSIITFSLTQLYHSMINFPWIQPILCTHWASFLSFLLFMSPQCVVDPFLLFFPSSGTAILWLIELGSFHIWWPWTSIVTGLCFLSQLEKKKKKTKGKKENQKKPHHNTTTTNNNKGNRTFIPELLYNPSMKASKNPKRLKHSPLLLPRLDIRSILTKNICICADKCSPWRHVLRCFG